MDIGKITSRTFEFAVDVAFMLTSAKAVLISAQERTESRGAHYRLDYTDTAPKWQQNICIQQKNGGMQVDTSSVSPPSKSVQEALDAGYELDYHQLE